jgi:hypothetical protein
VIYRVINRETISSVSSSTGITAALLPPTVSNVIYALVQAVSGPVRFTIDGSTPSTTLGLRLVTDKVVEIWGSEALSNFRCINDGGTATVEVITMGGGA